jgi:tripartite ATP-independent transporter DctP family solute receptor
MKKTRMFGGLITVIVLLVFTSSYSAEFTFKVAHNVSTKTLTHKVCMDFKGLVEERSDGRIEVVIFPSSQLGGTLELVDKVSEGVIQAAYVSMSGLSSLSPKLRFLLLPYLWPDWQMFTDYMMSPEARELYDEIENKNVLLEQVSNIMEFSIYTTDREVKTWKDLEGLKIRSQENPIAIGTFKSLGAAPMPLTFPEVYQALSRGVFDGIAIGAQFVLSAKFHEVLKYCTISQTFWSPCAFAVDKEYWKKLPEDIREILHKALADLFPDHRREWKSEYRNYIRQLQGKGITFRLITTKDALKRRELTKDLRLQCAKEWGFERVLKQLEDKYDPYWQKYDEMVQWYLN